MSSSLAAVFEGTPGKIELRSIPTPQPSRDEILVRVLGCTLCGSDIHSYEGRRNVATPTVLGHEIVGRIETCGPEATLCDFAGRSLKIGDRITWSIVANCGKCFYCQHHLPQKCTQSTKYGHEAFRSGYELLGGLAEHCLLVSGTAMAKLPDDLPLEVACPISCATATIAAAIEAAGDVRGKAICILGAGLLGLTACAMSRAAGAAEVICVEVHANRRARAVDFGATYAIAPEELADAVRQLTDARGIDVAFELSGAPAAFESAWSMVRTGGTIVAVGSVFPSPPVPLLLEQLVRRQLTLRGIHNYAPRNLLAAVDFMAECHHQYPFADIVAEWHPLTKIETALNRARDPSNIRVGVQMQGVEDRTGPLTAMQNQ